MVSFGREGSKAAAAGTNLGGWFTGAAQAGAQSGEKTATH